MASAATMVEKPLSGLCWLAMGRMWLPGPWMARSTNKCFCFAHNEYKLAFQAGQGKEHYLVRGQLWRCLVVLSTCAAFVTT